MSEGLRIVFLGAPGAGKGTQAQMLADKFDIPQLSTGNMFREAIANGTEIGKKAKSFMDQGNLVPDEITVGIVENRILEGDCEDGFILDGFPRNVSQAESLDKMLEKHNISLDFVFCLEVDEETIVERQSGRLFAPKSGRTYHEINNPPKVAGKCDVTGEDLVRRDDDKEDVVRHRLSVYREQTEPVKSYYEQTGSLIEFDGAQAVEKVFTQLVREIERLAVA